ncbi:MAG: Gfo/Idh/MocA family oxidoreductase [Acidobacteriia bacterium]|nr:Gfo/Idh/MocA family oxidoreductase [Terriglobia bacterium]
MRVGILGTGAVSRKHAEAYRNIGYELVACSGLDPSRGQVFAAQHRCEHVERWQDLCRHPRVDFVDLCTFPDFRLEPVALCAQAGKPVLMEKPISVTLESARRMLDAARAAGILLGVVSQHRFDVASQFLKRAIDAGRLGALLQADAYVKWYRPPVYYARPVKGTWAVEGGGALLTQAVHQVDLLLWLAGPVRHVSGEWQLGAVHRMESEDVVSTVMRYASGSTGVLQAATAFWPGLPERLEIHGTCGVAILTGDQLTTWEVQEDAGEPPPLSQALQSGAADPLAISLAPFERQFLDFGAAIEAGRPPLVAGEDGYRALALVDAIYRSCREGRRIALDA